MDTGTSANRCISVRRILVASPTETPLGALKDLAQAVRVLVPPRELLLTPQVIAVSERFMQRLQKVWSCGPELSRTYAAKGIQAHRLRLVEAGLRQRARSRIVQWWQSVTTVMTKISMHGRLGWYVVALVVAKTAMGQWRCEST